MPIGIPIWGLMGEEPRWEPMDKSACIIAARSIGLMLRGIPGLRYTPGMSESGLSTSILDS
jgi:hypothetical protein